MKQGQSKGHPEMEKNLKRKRKSGVPSFQTRREETRLSPRRVSEKRKRKKKGKKGEIGSQKVELLLLMDIICYKLRLRNCSQILNRLSRN